MIFFRITSFVLFFIFISLNAYSENHDQTVEQNIIEKAKDINKKLKENQAATQANIDSEIGKTEEPLPLNDPFAGDTATASSIVMEDEATEAALTLRNYKLAATFSGDFETFVTLVNDSGEYITLELFEELSEGVILVDASTKEATFQKEEDGKYLIINFKNQIKEKDAF
ncbi:uncharacterized protein METZ01_LOCUS342453 [marine metagenome]|uniref:Uncharacterized protein n=1 Tax=marine metagenome TaxID=408172 RepID=A0A382QVS7_9ZZZZ